MSDEDAFQRALDADPSNGLLRQVFADWLDDRGDPRAEGYRVLGALGRAPLDRFGGETIYAYWCHTSPDEPMTIPGSWWDRIRYTTEWPGRTRRGADDAAARAWLDLSDADRAAILEPREADRG